VVVLLCQALETARRPLRLLHACDAVLHTSASLTINENASPDVPLDLNARPPLPAAAAPVTSCWQQAVCIASFACLCSYAMLFESWHPCPQPVTALHVQDALDRIAPEGHHYRHLDEGMDDMPAHVKVRPVAPTLCEALHVCRVSNTGSGHPWHGTTVTAKSGRIAAPLF